ncbi:MAG: COR domain-containing protein, partial [Spirulinaceae cyanobacterium]
LYLSRNQLTALLAEIVQLTNLTELYLVGNQLTALPAEIVQLTNLTSLYLSDNQLSSLPAEIAQLTNLTSLDLRGNPLPISPEILGPKGGYTPPGDIKTIFDFYFATQDPKATEKLYEAKFLIVGEGGAGKTSLAKKIQDSDYQLNPEEESTHGLEVIQWRFPLDNGQEFRANLWDFGGQEIYHQTHQFFLTERSLYALVADTRQENTDFPYWLNSIELFGGDSPVLLIKNEKNDRPCNVNEARLKRDFHYIKEILPTNLKDGRGLEEIKNAIRYHISRLEYVGYPILKKWVRVRYTLENDSRNYIDQRDYFALCKGNGVNERSEMLRISDFLHKLGICLHFQEDSTLKHIVILRPEWATNAVYAVLKNQKVAAAKGLFTRSDVKNIWQERQYAYMEDELLRLMKNFKLCYPIPGLKEHYIAPQLLEFEPPDYEFAENDNLMLRYEYEFMPKGIITQLIVRLYRWIEQQQLVWRSGVVFNNGRARAEVIETYRPYKGEICVQVSGIHSKELLSVVTNEIDQINSSFERIDVKKKIPCNCKECQNDPEPYYFDLETLYRALNKRRYKIDCHKSFEDVNVRNLTAVVENNFFSGEDKKRIEQEEFERLKERHTEYYQPNSKTMSSKFHISAENVQIVESVAQGDAVIHKYADNPEVKTALDELLIFLKDLQGKHPDAKPEEAGEILKAEIVEMKQTQPQGWQKFVQQLRSLPQDIRSPERIMQASKSALVQVTTDLTDNVFLNAGVAFLDGLSGEPE